MDIFYEREQLPEHSKGVAFFICILADALWSLAVFLFVHLCLAFYHLMQSAPKFYHIASINERLMGSDPNVTRSLPGKI